MWSRDLNQAQIQFKVMKMMFLFLSFKFFLQKNLFLFP